MALAMAGMRDWREQMNNLKRHQQPHVTNVTFYSSSNLKIHYKLLETKRLKSWAVTTLSWCETTFSRGEATWGETDFGRNDLFPIAIST